MDNNRTSGNKSYSYLDAGFNRFFSRSIAADSTSGTLLQVSRVAGSMEINFDQRPVSGSLGDKISLGGGGIILDGPGRRISIFDEFDINVETTRVGKLDD